LIVLLWFGLFCFERYNQNHPSNIRESTNEKPPDPPQKSIPKATSTPSSVSSKLGAEKVTHQSLLETCVVQFHISQCYFSATIQIASLAYGIFSVDMLVTFLLLPLSINGVLPTVFGLLLLSRRGRDSIDIILLTVACWFLSSIVYWVLYSHIITINARFASETRRYIAYQQLTYKLSALDSCGGYSALAVCPDNFRVGREEVVSASEKLCYLTPIIWSFSTISLLLLLSAKVVKWHRERKNRQEKETVNLAAGSSAPEQDQHPTPNTMANSPLLEEAAICTENEHDDRAQQTQYHTARPELSLQPHGNKHFAFLRVERSLNILRAITTPCFLACICIQLSLLSISTSLRMMSRHDWGFGQIVAVAVWIPPLLEYMYDEIRVSVEGKLKAT
jgi:hypothetical protein